MIDGPIFKQHSNEVTAGITTWKELLIDDIQSENFEEGRQMCLNFARGELAWNFAKAARWQDVRSVLERQMQSGYFDDSIPLMLIEAYMQLGEKNRAVILARQMLNKYPDNSQWKSAVQTTENLPD